MKPTAATRPTVLLVSPPAPGMPLIQRAIEKKGWRSVCRTAPEAFQESKGLELAVIDVQHAGPSTALLAAALRSHAPQLRIVLMAKEPCFEHAMLALELEAETLIHGPAPWGQLERVLNRSVPKQLARKMRTVLAIGAHPDDVEIGLAGTLAKHREAQDRIVVLTLSGGGSGGDSKMRRREALEAARRMGAELVHLDFEDTRIPEDEPVITAMEDLIRRIRPDVVYTHSLNDNHQDHRAVHRASLVAARGVPTVLAYQSPSANVDFRPTRFVAIDRHFDAKLWAVDAYASQVGIRPYLDPNLLESNAKYWGRFRQYRLVEPFEVIRDAAFDIATADLGAALRTGLSVAQTNGK
ncbi:MAG: PIG-L deacetylase family protein [Myxococcota bacterium]